MQESVRDLPNDSWRFVILPEDFSLESEMRKIIFKPHVKLYFEQMKYEYLKENQSLIGLIDEMQNIPYIPMPVLPEYNVSDFGVLSPPDNTNNQLLGKKARKFQCPECTHRFSRNHDLKRHLRIHMGVKPYNCEKCSKGFTRTDALNRHIAIGCAE